MQFALLNAKVSQGLSKISRFYGRFGVGYFDNFSIELAAALKRKSIWIK
jgi:hypothetical protein